MASYFYRRQSRVVGWFFRALSCCFDVAVVLLVCCFCLRMEWFFRCCATVDAVVLARFLVYFCFAVVVVVCVSRCV